MKKLSVLMSALVMALAFVACEKDEPTPAPKLEVKDAVEVVIGESTELEIKGGVAPYEAKSANEEVVTVKVEGAELTITAVKVTEEPAPEARETGGEETVEPVVVTVTDKAGTKVTVKVTVKEAEVTPEA